MSASSVDFALLRVMIVDDNRHMRTLVCSILHALKIKTSRKLVMERGFNRNKRV
jgi:hypothetical protein